MQFTEGRKTAKEALFFVKRKKLVDLEENVAQSAAKQPHLSQLTKLAGQNAAPKAQYHGKQQHYLARILSENAELSPVAPAALNKALRSSTQDLVYLWNFPLLPLFGLLPFPAVLLFTAHWAAISSRV